MPVNFIIPDSGPFRSLYSRFRSDRRFARDVRNGGVPVVLDMDRPVLYVRAHGNTLWADEDTLYNGWMYGMTGKDYIRVFHKKRGHHP